MKERTTRSLLRSVALVGAMAAGATAFGAKDQVWSGGASGSWDGANWTDGTYDNGNYVVNDSSQDVTITFGSATTISTGLWIENGTEHTVTFDQPEGGADADAGLTASSFNIGTGTGAGNLKLAFGQYVSTGDVAMSNGGTGILTLEGGKLTCGTADTVKWFLLGHSSTAGSYDTTVNLNEGGVLEVWHIQRYTTGGTCKINFNGGTLRALGDNQQLVGDNWPAEKRYPTIVVGEKGGTIDTNGKTVTIDAPVTGTGTLNVIGGGTATFSFIPEDTVTITAAEGTTLNVAKDATFTWTGAAEDGLWATPRNWTVAGEVATTAPAADSTVVIPEGDGTLTISAAGSTDYTGTLTINRDVTLTGTGITLGTVSGTGKLTVDAGEGNTFNCAGDGEINTELNVLNGLNCGTATITVNGALTGTGVISFDNKSNAVPGLHMNGDTSGFYGTYSASYRDYGDRDGTSFGGDARGSENAGWRFGNDDSSKQKYTPFKHENGLEYKFGYLVTVGYLYNNKSQAWATGGQDGERNNLSMHYRASSSDYYLNNTTLTVGALENSTSNIGGTLFNGTTADATAPNKIVKVGNSTAYVTLTTNDGALEANGGTLILKGTTPPVSCTLTGAGASVTVMATVGTYETTTVEHEAVEADPDNNIEAQEAWTETITTQTAGFVPTLGTALAGYTMVSTDNVENDVVVSTTYTTVKTVKDVNDVEYYTVAEAVAALENAENKTITLIANSSEAIALPLGYTLVMNGFTAGSVAGDAGVAVSYNEGTGTWTTVDNSTATWQGGTEGNWFDADNWSSGYVPDAGTAVTFTGNATVFLKDNNTYDCGSIYISKDNATVTFAPVGYNESKWPRVKVYGNIGAHGNCVLKLYRCGIDNGTTERVTVRPTLQFYNTTGDSWVTGNFSLQAGLTGTGEFRVYSGTIHFESGSGIDVAAGSTVDFRNYYPTFEGRSGTLSSTGVNGDGRIIVHALPTSSTLTYFQNAFKNAGRWSGTCELAGVTANNLNFSDYGNANSVVCINGVKGYLVPPANWGTVNVAEIKELNIAAGGLTLNGGAYSQKYYLFNSALTGSGPIAFGTSCGNVSYYVFTGDVSGFTGAINFGSLTTSNAPGVVFRTTSETSDLSAGHGTITVQEGVTLDVASTWTAPGGFKVMGTVNPSSLSVLSGSVLDVSTGTVVLPATEISTKTGLPLPALSSANGTLVIKGITRSDASKSLYLGSGAACTIAGTTQLDGNLHVTDGNSNATYTWNKITGTGDILFTTAGGSASGITHAITRLDGYSGTIDVGGNATLTLGTVAVDAVEVGTPLVKLSSTCNMTDEAVAAVAVEVGGEALEGASVVKTTDGLYIAAAAVTVTPAEGDPVTTPYATYDAAVAAADEAGVTTVTVLYGDGAVNGWDYDLETGILTKNTTAIARVGTTNYNTLAAAFDVATAGDTVVLFGASAEAAALAADGATLEIDTTAAYTGTLSGDGTVVANAAFTPVFGEWTGTFVVNWNLSGTSSKKAAVVLDNYGVAGSTVRVTQALENFYFKHKDKANSADVQPAVYFEADVTQNDGYTYGYNGGLATIFAEVGMAEGATFSTRGAGGNGNKYIFTKLSGFEGTLNVRSTDIVEINGVELAETPAFGTKVVSATAAATASVTAKIADGYPLVLKDDGLYFDPVAQVGEAYYNTAVEAITAAAGAVVDLVQTTDETYSIAAGETVKIRWNSLGNVTIVAAVEGDTVDSSWDETAGVTTYTCTAQGGVEPGAEAEYDTAEAANAATMAVPAAVDEALTAEQVNVYKTLFERKVTAPTTEGGKYVVSYVLTEQVKTIIKTELAGELTKVDVAALGTSKSAQTVTIDAVPGLYFGVQSQNSLEAGALVTTESSVLATSDTVTVTFPAADDSAQKFFMIFASPTAPAASSAGDDANVGNEAGSGAGA